MVSSILRVGDKIDIRILQQIEAMEKTGETPHIYKSMVNDIKDNGDMEIGMPTEGGRLVLLTLGARYEMVIYAQGGLYRCIGQVKERYKSDNLYMLLMEIKTALTKYQRREYYRLEWVTEIEYMPITAEEAKMPNPAEIGLHHLEDFPQDCMKKGIAVDLSGGGIRVLTEDVFEKNSYLLIRLTLKNDRLEREYHIPGRILYAARVQADNKKYEYRIQFVMKNVRVREQIIKFIFEEERKHRKNNKG